VGQNFVWVGQARVWVGHGLPGLIARTASGVSIWLRELHAVERLTFIQEQSVPIY